MTPLGFLLRARARVLPPALHPVFLFFRGTRKNARRRVAKRKRKKTRGGGGDPSCVVLPESSVNLVGWGVALCVVWLRCLTSRGDVPGEGSQSSRRLEDSVCTCEQRVELLARSTSIREPPREILKVVVNCIPHFLLRRSWISSGKRRCHSRIQLHFVKRSYYISWW